MSKTERLQTVGDSPARTRLLHEKPCREKKNLDRLCGNMVVVVRGGGGGGCRGSFSESAFRKAAEPGQDKYHLNCVN